MEPATPKCRACQEPLRPVSAVTVAIIVLLAVVVICCLMRHLGGKQKDGFASPRAHAAYRDTRALFEETQGGASFSDFKTRVPDGDAVVYTDARRLWRAGQLSPEAMQEII